jgi:hypothetical protein
MSELTTQTALRTCNMDSLSPTARELLPLAFSEFLDTAATATARATFYNSRAEQEAAVYAVHQELFELDRGLYTAALLLPGMTDFSRQTGIARLLRVPHEESGLLTLDQENRALRKLLSLLPAQRVLKLFGALRASRVNNARTRRLILSTLLDAKQLEFQAVKYRRKLETAFTHAWGRRTASILRTILSKAETEWTTKERQIVERNLGRFIKPSQSHRVAECVRFILGDESGLTLPRLVAYRDAKQDLTAGRLLPFEALEGLRSRYHPDQTSAEVLELSKVQLTKNQKLNLQRKAQESDVKVEFDPRNYDPVRLYIYAFERGMDNSIRDALLEKARVIADQLPVHFGHVGILLDVSESMYGSETQALRPMAVALALRDVLSETASQATVMTSDGRVAAATELIEPAGDTSLAGTLIALLKQEPDAVFVLSDGYENAPAGRFAEVIRAVRQMGISTPVHQLTPVFAAEARGLRSLSPQVPGLPVSQPESIGLGLLKAQFAIDVNQGVSALLTLVRPVLELPAPQVQKVGSH